MNRTAKLASLALLFSGLVIFLLTASDAAELKSTAVQITIGSILASNNADDFDSRLAPLEKQLKLMKYRSYRLLKEESHDVQPRGSATFEIPGGHSLIVTHQDSNEKQIALRVRLHQGAKPVIDTTVRINSGGNFLLGGPPHDGGALVLSISAGAP